ncbi:replication initiator protein A [Pelagimonas varians]|uniref:Replication initiator protein A n=1 Tax=Pelagimonas varians TaxID=696760 RepID=A0A238L5R5_9RHOB|nr:replication initiator protein A [Pelagimonas varians]PYG25473.1 replication initiator protein A [Pelagimonas varians]SMX50328.1 Replication initiator protein A [Pelagimonas varians]
MDPHGHRPPLLPVRHPTQDFFVCDIFDAAPKGDMASMEHPIFSLSTKPDRRQRRYEMKDRFVEITPSVLGLATIHDRDILIYCISQLIAAANAGDEISSKVRFKAYDLLTATNRMTNGQGYEGLKSALERLRGTTISTNISTGGEEQLDVFGLIDRAKIVRQTRDGRMQEVEVELSEWVFNAIRSNEVLTLHRDYFRLRKPLERRIYEIARKHCGMKAEWRIGLALLQKKCGSNSSLREFKRLVQGIVAADLEHDHLPDYQLRLEDDQVVFSNKGTMLLSKDVVDVVPTQRLLSQTFDEAKLAAPGWDVYYLEQEWRSWMSDGGLDGPRDADKAFLGFCHRWYERRGAP